MMSQEPPEVVVSGISCRLPQSDNMEEFRDNLMNGVDMVTEDSLRWPPGLHGLPRRSGKLKDLSKFDAAYFGVHPKQANRMDPQLRMLLEVTYEAIVDAGVNPESIRGTKTGVFIGAGSNESHEAWSADPDNIVGYTLTGCSRAMFANRLSFFFNFNGPSYSVSTACSSSLLALDQAWRSIRSGECDSAIVGGTTLCLKPGTAVQYLKLGMLSPDGKCKSFDADGQGFCRSEGIVSMFLQKNTAAKRIYCTFVHSKTNNDGYKEQGITFPSGQIQKTLLSDTYTEAGIDPASVLYVEAHGTGTKVGDVQEVNTICDVFCKDRQGPLLIGSVKSNMGHSEIASGMAAMAKVIVSMKEGTIPGNLHYMKPNPNIPGLVNGKLQVVSSNTKLEGGLVGVVSMGFGGSNVHVVLKSNPQKSQQFCGENKQKRLFLYSSRSEEGLKGVLERARMHQEDQYFHALMNESAHTPPSSHPFRGFTVLNSLSEINMKKVSDGFRPVWLIFSGMGTQWTGMGKHMMELDIFRATIVKLDTVLLPYDIALYDLLMDTDGKLSENVIHSFVAITAIQIALFDVLTSVGIEADGIIGHSIGEVACAYADGCLTAEETILVAYWRGHCIKSAQLPLGGMAAVGLSWQECIDQCPADVVPACHNSADTVTISGPKEEVNKFVKVLETKEVFAREVDSAGVAFHSYLMKGIAPTFKIALVQVIKKPKLRTARWISSSVPEKDWSSDLACSSSADYFVNNLIRPVLFHEALLHVPSNSVVIEVAPHYLLQAILKRSLSTDCCIVGLMKKGHEENVEVCLSGLGRCYQNGVNVDPLKLCSPVTFPVPNRTPMISPLVKWDHTQLWDVPVADMFVGGGSSQNGCGFDIDISPDSQYHFLVGHTIERRVLFPATGYILLAWKTLAKMKGIAFDMMAVKFEDVHIHFATILSENNKVHFGVTIQPGSNNFEIMDGSAVCVTGKVTAVENTGMTTWPTPDEMKTEYELTASDVYGLFRAKGFEFGPTFQGILCSDLNGENARLRWTGEWISYLDTMLQLTILFKPNLPTRIKAVTIDPVIHTQFIKNYDNGIQGIDAKVNKNCDMCMAGGVMIHGLHTASTQRRDDLQEIITQKYQFVPHILPTPMEPASSLIGYSTESSLHASGLSNDFIENQEKPRLNKRGHIKSVIDENVYINTDVAEKDESSRDEQQNGNLSLLQKNDGINDTESLMPDTEQNNDQMTSDCSLDCLNIPANLKPCLDLVVENTPIQTLKVMEVTKSGMRDHIFPLLSDDPNINISYTVAVKTQESRENCDYQTIIWSPEVSPRPAEKVHLIVARNILHKQVSISTGIGHISKYLEDDGFLLVEEVTQNFHLVMPLDVLDEGIDDPRDLDIRSSGCYCTAEKWRELFAQHGFTVVYERCDLVLSTLFLLRKRSCSLLENQTVVEVSRLECNWVDELKQKTEECQSKPKGENLWLVSDDRINGIVGLVNCLRLESGGDRIRCVLNMGKEHLPDIRSTIKTLIPADMVMNVYKDSQWGSFRNLPLPTAPLVKSNFAYVNIRTHGDLSSLQWFQSSLRHFDAEINTHTELCDVHYASLNFRDVMLATGKLPPDAIPAGPVYQECMLGMEFSGVDGSGRRVMGIVPTQGLATAVAVNKRYIWQVPDNWSLEEAASVPVVYATAYYAMVVRGNIQHGDSILIHSGSGGVGQAAISIALNYKCEIFTTVGSDEKREFLKSRFPEIDDAHIFNSRDTSFEFGVMTATNGKGVDIVLNSLAEEKLQASIRVLCKHGSFLEIGKFDLSENTPLGMAIFLNNVSVHGIMLDALFEEGNREWNVVFNYVFEGIASGVVRPLNTTSFGTRDIEAAFRFMAQGKHIGKVVVEIRKDDAPLIQVDIPAVPRSACHGDKCYIITGGLGGFGLELADWLVTRGAKCLILTSRSGIKTGYQARKIKFIQEQGVNVILSLLDVSDIEHANLLVSETNGKPVGGVFHLAAVLQDRLLENQDIEAFQQVCAPKVSGTINLDKVTRAVCKDSCDWFVVFSSVICERGNIGQSNYGFANSTMERICEQRQEDGLPGLAIQWGVVRDVGLAFKSKGDNTSVIRGTVPQRMTSCLTTLDMFLNQSHPVVASHVTAERQHTVDGGSEDSRNPVSIVCRILGISDPKSVSHDTSLAEFGIDSLMTVEVRQALERDFQIQLTLKQIPQLSLKSLPDLVRGSE